MPLVKFGNKVLKFGGKCISVKGAPFSQTDFNDIADIYASLQPGDKVAFLLRHGERGPGYGKEEPLTEEGIQECLAVGAKLRGGAADKNQIEAHSTDFVRTQQTAFYIAKSRGDDLWGTDDGDYVNVPTDHNIDSDLYYADGVSGLTYEEISAYAYEVLGELYPEDLNKFKSIDLITNLITDTIVTALRNSDKPLLLFTSHDSVLLPYTVHASKKKLDCLKFWENHHWLYFCAGTAVVMRANGSVETYPVKGLDMGWFRPW